MSTVTIPWRSAKRHRIHEFTLDPDTWTCVCGLPESNRWHSRHSDFNDFWYDPHLLPDQPTLVLQ